MGLHNFASHPAPLRRILWLTIYRPHLTMKEVAVYEAKTRLSELLLEVERGEQVTITRRGVAIARLVSVAAPKRIATSQRQGVAAIFAQLRAQRDGVVLKGKLKDIAGAGRD